MSKAAQLLVVVIGLLSIVSTTARGDTDHSSAARTEAKRLRDLGAAAMDKGAIAEALAAFERAYELFPSPNLRFNIGVALEGLGRLAEAVDAFEDFLDAPSAPADARAYAKTRLQELEPQIARLALAISPPSAEIHIDGKRVSLSRGRALPVMPGERSVTAALDSYATMTERMAVTAGARARLDLTLQPIRRDGLVPPTPDSVPTNGDAAARRRVRVLGAAALGTGAVGVAALVLGIVFAERTASVDHEANHPPPGSQFDPALVSRGRTYQALEETFFTVGAAAAGSAVAIGIIAARKRHHLSVAAPVAGSSIGLVVAF